MLRILSVWLILFFSKFLILEVVDFVFGDRVELGSFLEVVALVISLMVARELFDRVYRALGNSNDGA